MSDKKFDAKKSSEIALSFLKKLQTDCASRFSEAGLEGIRRVIEALSYETTTSELWKTTYQITFGEPFTEQVWISEEEVLTTLISLCIRQMFQWEYDLMELIDLLFFTRYPPEENKKEYEKEWVLWKEIVTIFSSGAFAHDENPPTGKRFSGKLFADLIGWFLDEIYSRYRHRLVEAALSDLEVYYSDTLYNGSYPDLYEKTYKRMTGNTGLKTHLLTEETLFTLTIEMCAINVYKWGFYLKEILILLFTIRYSMESDQDEIKMWKVAWQSSLTQSIEGNNPCRLFL